MSKIKVLYKEPGKRAEVKEIENTLEALQAAVGGYIETVTLATDAVIICDEEGLLKGKEYNCHIGGVGFVGTIIMAGVTGDEFADCQTSVEVFESRYAKDKRRN